MLDIFHVLAHLVLPHRSQICKIVFILMRLIILMRLWGTEMWSYLLEVIQCVIGGVDFWPRCRWTLNGSSFVRSHVEYSNLLSSLSLLMSHLFSLALSYTPTALVRLSSRWMLLDPLKPTDFSQILSSFLNASSFIVLRSFFSLNRSYSHLTISPSSFCSKPLVQPS